MNDKTWVDFKAIKSAVSMEMMLARYNVNWLGKKHDELRGRCPIHQGEGKDTFHVNVSKNVFNCFSCKKRGNVLDFVATMEKCSVRDAAVKIGEWFSITGETTAEPEKTKRAEVGGGVGETVATFNKPLTFQLKNVDTSHPYLAERGISKETAETFGVGFFSGKGSMSGRIVIPIHNSRGELVAYSGRSIDGSEPRYKLPLGFQKSLELFNVHRLSGPLVILVEGFFDCMKVHQAGFPVVSLMGSSLSKAQAEVVATKFQRVVVMLDGDEPGRLASAESLKALAARAWVREITLQVGQQPDQLSCEDIAQVLSIV
jgi:DNA primase